MTAGPTLAAVVEPPETGAFGKLLSPSSDRTRVIGSPNSSAASWAMIV